MISLRASSRRIAVATAVATAVAALSGHFSQVVPPTAGPTVTTASGDAPVAATDNLDYLF
jgi:hypothetical protein